MFRGARTTAPRRLTAGVANTPITLGWQQGVPPAVEAGSVPGAADLGTFNVGTATQVTGTPPAGTYHLRVRGIYPSGVSAASTEAIATVPSTSTPPYTPGTLSALVTGGIVTLRWEAASGNATTYAIETGTASGLSNVGTFVTGHLDTTFVTPAPTGTYFVRVRAANASLSARQGPAVLDTRASGDQH